jgi:hypothetical protein
MEASCHDPRVYQLLHAFNTSIGDALNTLKALQQTTTLKHLSCQNYMLQLEELRALVSEEIAARLSEIELRTQLTFGENGRTLRGSLRPRWNASRSQRPVRDSHSCGGEGER